MIARLLRPFADRALRADRDRYRALARRATRELAAARRSIETLQDVCDRYSDAMSAASERLRQMREGQ